MNMRLTVNRYSKQHKPNSEFERSIATFEIISIRFLFAEKSWCLSLQLHIDHNSTVVRDEHSIFEPVA